jgi:hypothetical protein
VILKGFSNVTIWIYDRWTGQQGKISRKPIDFYHDFSMTASTVIMVLSTMSGKHQQIKKGQKIRASKSGQAAFWG